MDHPPITFSASAGESVSSGEPSDQDTPPAPKRRRGRPQGSKNKPKAPPVATGGGSHNLAVVEIPAGADLTDSLLRFSRRRRLSIMVLTASGSISIANLRCPSNSTETAFTAVGSFSILSLSGTVAENSSSLVTLLGRTGGEVFGGTIAGSVLAASKVNVVVATTELEDSMFQRFAGAGEDNNSDDSNRCYSDNGDYSNNALALSDESPLGEVLRECHAIQRFHSQH